MSVKRFSKKVIAAVLAVAMLLSFPIAAAPLAVAEEAHPVEDYYIEIDVSIINCDNGYSAERPFLGPDVRNPGAMLGGGDAYYKDMGGMVIWYTDENGRGENVSADTIDFGPNGLNYVYNGGPAGEHTIAGTLSGFPTSFAVYNNNDHNHSVLGSGDVEWSVNEIRIGSDEDHMSTLWKGDCHVKNRNGAQPTRYKVDFNGNVSVWSVEGISDSTMEVNDYTYVKNSAGNFVMNKTDASSYLANREPWTLPYLNSLVATGEESAMWGDLAIVNDESTFRAANNYYCTDQYGVKIAEPVVAYDIVNYNGEDYSTAAVVDADYIQTCGDIRFDQKEGKIFAGESGYAAGESATHPFTTRATYIFGGKSLAVTESAVLTYPEIPVIWSYKATKEGAVVTEQMNDSVLFGNTIKDSDYPGEDSTRVYYTEDYHFKNGSFVTVRITDETLLEMQGYESEAHSLSMFVPIEGDDTYHHHACACGYAVKEAHAWNSGEITKKAGCTEAGEFTYTCTACGGEKHEEIAKTGHSWDNGTVTKPSTCFENGIKTYTCTVCGETKTEKINALEHAPVLHRNLPADKQAGGAYYQCDNCGSYWAAAYDSEKEQYTIPDEEPAASLEEALAASDSLPAPYFNIFYDTDERVQYDYSTRGASLKYEYLKRPDYQPMRFSASVRVPEGVNDAIGAAGNAITDVGIIYSQTKLIEGLDAFTIGAENVYRMSVKSKNSAAVYDGSNWGGVTKHESADGTHLTFNLVVNVLPENWREEYCARAYITYNYCGFEYTVYDEAFSTRSVAYLAQKVVESPSETQAAKDYCQSEILDILEQL